MAHCCLKVDRERKRERDDHCGELSSQVEQVDENAGEEAAVEEEEEEDECVVDE